jgi:PAS domain S-box-containing protein
VVEYKKKTNIFVQGAAAAVFYIQKGRVKLTVISKQGREAGVDLGLMQPDKTEQLLSSEVRYRRLFESAKDGILILDAGTGEIIDINPFMLDLLGYSRQEFLGIRLWEIGPFRDKRNSQESFRELQENVTGVTSKGERQHRPMRGIERECLVGCPSGYHFHLFR